MDTGIALGLARITSQPGLLRFRAALAPELVMQPLQRSMWRVIRGRVPRQ